MRPAIRYALYAALAIVAVSLFFAYREPIFAAVKDPIAIRAWLESLGPWGPVGLIALFALQVLIAPVPGYVFQVIAGYLFGWVWGTIYSTIGMLIGGALAMTLARAYGRPLVSKAVGADRLQRWENVTHLNSLGLWFLLMLGPLGDMLFFLAGLTTLSVWKIMVVAALVRAPSLTVSAAVGAGQIDWRSPWVIGGFIVLLGIGVIGVRYQDRIERWVARRAPPQLPSAPVLPEATAPTEGS